MNKVFIVGRLTRDPEHRTTPNGVSVTTLGVAVTRRMNREEADFFNVVAWRGLADNCAKYLVKGQQIAVVGELRTRSYEAKDGTKRYVTEIQADDIEFLAKPGASGAGASSGGSRSYLETLRYANLSNPFTPGSVARACGYAAEILLGQIERQEQNA